MSWYVVKMKRLHFLCHIDKKWVWTTADFYNICISTLTWLT